MGGRLGQGLPLLVYAVGTYYLPGLREDLLRKIKMIRHKLQKAVGLAQTPESRNIVSVLSLSLCLFLSVVTCC